ncbi:MAG: hypothetical protein AAFY28_18300 [Actinomycetota bacterium]
MAMEHRRSRRTAVGGMIAVGVAVVAVAACDDDGDEGTPDELLRIDSPAQVDPSFEGLDGRQP